MNRWEKCQQTCHHITGLFTLFSLDQTCWRITGWWSVTQPAWCWQVIGQFSDVLAFSSQPADVLQVIGQFSAITKCLNFFCIKPANITQVFGQFDNLPDVSRSLVCFWLSRKLWEFRKTSHSTENWPVTCQHNAGWDLRHWPMTCFTLAGLI